MAVEQSLVLENLGNVLVHLIAVLLKQRRLAHKNGIYNRKKHKHAEKRVESNTSREVGRSPKPTPIRHVRTHHSRSITTGPGPAPQRVRLLPKGAKAEVNE